MRSAPAGSTCARQSVAVDTELAVLAPVAGGYLFAAADYVQHGLSAVNDATGVAVPFFASVSTPRAVAGYGWRFGAATVEVGADFAQLGAASDLVANVAARWERGGLSARGAFSACSADLDAAYRLTLTDDLALRFGGRFSQWEPSRRCGNVPDWRTPVPASTTIDGAPRPGAPNAAPSRDWGASVGLAYTF